MIGHTLVYLVGRIFKRVATLVQQMISAGKDCDFVLSDLHWSTESCNDIFAFVLRLGGIFTWAVLGLRIKDSLCLSRLVL